MKKITNQFWAMPKEIMEIKELSLEARIVYSILWTRANGDNVAWPGQKYIAEILGVGERSVRRYLDELKNYGLIEVERQGLKKTNRYFLTGQVGRSGADTAVRSRADTAVLSIVREEKKEKRSNTSNDTVVAGHPDSKFIVEIFDIFRAVNPAVSRMYGNKAQRGSITRLSDRYGPDTVLRATKAAVSILGRDRFAPKITTPYELETNWAKLVAYFKTETNKPKSTGFQL